MTSYSLNALLTRRNLRLGRPERTTILRWIVAYSCLFGKSLVAGILALCVQPAAVFSLDLNNGTTEPSFGPSWESMLANAARPAHGLVLTARPVIEAGKVGCRAHLVLSLTNVSKKDVRFPASPFAFPQVLIRDDSGTQLRMSKEGSDRYWRAVFAGGSTYSIEIPPGYSCGTSILLNSYYDLTKRGKYALLASLDCPPETAAEKARPYVASNIVSLDTREERAEDVATKSVPSFVLKSDRSPISQGDWNRAIAVAGRLVDHCILDAMVSPIDSDDVTLIVSLRCLDVRAYYSPDCGAYPADYQVFVRDSQGNMIPRNPKACRESVDSRPSYIRYGSSLSPGAAVGTAIPLAKWFDISKPGEYAALVVLRSRDKSSLWLAPVVKIKVGHLSK